MELEPERLASEEGFIRGERSDEHIAHGYLARGDYAAQLRRWFDAVGRDRILVMASERLFSDPTAPDEVLAWLGLRPFDVPYPAKHGASRLEKASPELVARIDAHFAPKQAELAALLGQRPVGTGGRRPSPGSGSEATDGAETS